MPCLIQLLYVLVRFVLFHDTVTNWHYAGFVAVTVTYVLGVRSIVAGARDGMHARCVHTLTPMGSVYSLTL